MRCVLTLDAVTFWDRHDAEELEVQAGDGCLSDVLAQPLHRGQGEGDLVPVQDLQEANLNQEAAVTLLGDHDHRVMQLFIKVDVALGALHIMAGCKADTPDSGLVA